MGIEDLPFINYCSYVKTGNNVRIILVADIPGDLSTFALIIIGGLPFPVLDMAGLGWGYYLGYFENSFVDNIDGPGAGYQRLNLKIVTDNGLPRIITAVNER